MKQKTSLAISLVHDPSVIIFDEPTNGLDVLTAKTVTDFLVEMKEEGKTILLPGLLLFGMWSIMGAAMDDMVSNDGQDVQKIAVVNLPASIVSVTGSANIEFIDYDEAPDNEAIRKSISDEEYQALAVFPEDFDEEVTAALGGSDPTTTPQICYGSWSHGNVW